MSTNTTLSADTDYHVVISADRSSAANSKIYINGVDNTTITTMTTTNVSLAADVHIGRWSGGSGYNWDGIIDEFKIYDYAISADEANDLYYEFD